MNSKAEKSQTSNLQGCAQDIAADPNAPQNNRMQPYVTLWQDEKGVIQFKLGNGVTPVNALALLELGIFRYKAELLPSISPGPSRAPEGSDPGK